MKPVLWNRVDFTYSHYKGHDEKKARTALADLGDLTGTRMPFFHFQNSDSLCRALWDLALGETVAFQSQGDAGDRSFKASSWHWQDLLLPVPVPMHNWSTVTPRRGGQFNSCDWELRVAPHYCPS
jgi:hypothetical protein